MKTKFMSKMVLFLMVILSFSAEIFSQDTFSIVAVDTVTGEIGSAGASCVGGGVGAFILSDVIEGIGAIHTQAYWNATNQLNGSRNRMLESLSPQEIIDWLVANDAQGNPTIRQYGIVDLTRNQNGRIGAGGAYRLTDRFKTSGEISTGDMGAGAKLGTEYLYSDRTNLYLNYALENERTDSGIRAQRGNMSRDSRLTIRIPPASMSKRNIRTVRCPLV